MDSSTNKKETLHPKQKYFKPFFGFDIHLYIHNNHSEIN